jgi:hypothetical protein
MLVAIGGASQAAFALDDTYLRCKGSIAIFLESGVQSVEKQEIAAHVMPDLDSGTDFRYRDWQKC